MLLWACFVLIKKNYIISLAYSLHKDPILHKNQDTFLHFRIFDQHSCSTSLDTRGWAFPWNRIVFLECQISLRAIALTIHISVILATLWYFLEPNAKSLLKKGVLSWLWTQKQNLAVNGEIVGHFHSRWLSDSSSLLHLTQSPPPMPLALALMPIGIWPRAVSTKRPYLFPRNWPSRCSLELDSIYKLSSLLMGYI